MILLGDWGGIPYRPYYTPFEYITAEQLMSYSNKNDVDSVLALGDNFYFDGVKNEYDKRFKVRYEIKVFAVIFLSPFKYFYSIMCYDIYYLN